MASQVELCSRMPCFPLRSTSRTISSKRSSAVGSLKVSHSSRQAASGGTIAWSEAMLVDMCARTTTGTSWRLSLSRMRRSPRSRGCHASSSSRTTTTALRSAAGAPALRSLYQAMRPSASPEAAPCRWATCCRTWPRATEGDAAFDRMGSSRATWEPFERRYALRSWKVCLWSAELSPPAKTSPMGSSSSCHLRSPCSRASSRQRPTNCARLSNTGLWLWAMQSSAPHFTPSQQLQ
mmetsp:Transcript_15022/g.35782  ORF Transcript_15022/g.35782 Transcript_15022/m.35782 type:complete len:236 (-) Transcript_15022:318-1025(-)